MDPTNFLPAADLKAVVEERTLAVATASIDDDQLIVAEWEKHPQGLRIACLNLLRANRGYLAEYERLLQHVQQHDAGAYGNSHADLLERTRRMIYSAFKEYAQAIDEELARQVAEHRAGRPAAASAPPGDDHTCHPPDVAEMVQLEGTDDLPGRTWTCQCGVTWTVVGVNEHLLWACEKGQDAAPAQSAKADQAHRCQTPMVEKRDPYDIWRCPDCPAQWRLYPDRIADPINAVGNPEQQIDAMAPEWRRI